MHRRGLAQRIHRVAERVELGQRQAVQIPPLNVEVVGDLDPVLGNPSLVLVLYPAGLPSSTGGVGDSTTSVPSGSTTAGSDSPI